MQLGVHRNHDQLFTVGEVQLVKRRIVRAAAVWIVRPSVEEVFSGAADDVIVALTAKDDVHIRRGTFGRAIAPQLIISTETVDAIGTKATEDLVAAIGAEDDVIARATVHDTNIVAAALRQRIDVDGIPALDKANDVVTAKTADAELLYQRSARGAGPAQQNSAQCGATFGRLFRVPLKGERCIRIVIPCFQTRCSNTVPILQNRHWVDSAHIDTRSRNPLGIIDCQLPYSRLTGDKTEVGE